MIRRFIAAGVLAAFMVATAVYIVVYLIRSFQPDDGGERALVGLWHGDNFSRAIFVAILFLIGEVFAVYLALAWQRRTRAVQVRPDMLSWLERRSALTGESTDHIAERAISLYRLRLEGGPQGVPSAPEPVGAVSWLPWR